MGFYSRHIFSRLLDASLGSTVIQSERKKALATARGEVLEIGFGTGLNLPFYPDDVTKLVAIDSEKMLEERVSSRIAIAKMPVEQIQLDASGKLPFADASFDTVVTTFTLCSIKDVSSALIEMRRVLKPSGAFLFCEHGRSDDAKIARWQDRLNPLQNIIACGCNINRPIDQLIIEASFQLLNLERYVLPDMPRIFSEIYRGAACGVR